MAKELIWELIVILCLMPYVICGIWLVGALPVDYGYTFILLLTLLQCGLAGIGQWNIRQTGDSSVMLLVWVIGEFNFLSFAGLMLSLIGQTNPDPQRLVFLAVFTLINLVSLFFLCRFIVRMRRWDSPVSRHMRIELVARIVNYFPTPMTRPAPDFIRFFCDQCGRQTDPADLIGINTPQEDERFVCPSCRATISTIPSPAMPDPTSPFFTKVSI